MSVKILIGDLCISSLNLGELSSVETEIRHGLIVQDPGCIKPFSDRQATSAFSMIMPDSKWQKLLNRSARPETAKEKGFLEHPQ